MNVPGGLEKDQRLRMAVPSKGPAHRGFGAEGTTAPISRQMVPKLGCSPGRKLLAESFVYMASPLTW